MSGYVLHVCVDFFDDLIFSGPFDRERLGALFTAFRDAGMRRVYWVYTHRFDAGYLGRTPYARLGENATETFRRMGEGEEHG